MKATSGAITYGASVYPIEDTNLPNVPLQDAIKAVERAIRKLSGQHGQKVEYITFTAVGNGFHIAVEGDYAREDTARDTHFDYERQAWVVDGHYVDCGHLLAQPCRCYGRLHKGEAEVLP